MNLSRWPTCVKYILKLKSPSTQSSYKSKSKTSFHSLKNLDLDSDSIWSEKIDYKSKTRHGNDVDETNF